MKLIKIHKAYMLNMLNIIILLLVAIISFILFLINIKTDTNYNNYFYHLELLSSYVDMFILYFKLVMIMLFCYVLGSSYTKKSDSYHLLILNFPHIRIKYLLTKILLSLFIPLFFMFIMFLIFSYVGIFFTNWYYVTKNIINLFITCYLIITIYGLLSIIMALIIPSTYACFIPGIIFVFGELLKDHMSGKMFLNIFELFFPLINNSDASFTLYGIYHLILLMIIYINLIILLYLKKR